MEDKVKNDPDFPFDFTTVEPKIMPKFDNVVASGDNKIDTIRKEEIKTDKGQLISKCPFAVFKSTKKPKEIFKDLWPSLKNEVKLKNKGTLHH